MKVAFFSPLSPQRSGISDYSEDLLPSLAQGATLELFTDEGVSPTNSKIIDNFPVYPYTQFGRRHQAAPYDLCLYQMGNNPKYHHYMDALIQTYPGIVTLHDYALQHLYIFLCTKQKRFDEYQEMMETYYGPEGRVIANNFRKGILHDYVFYQYPLFQRVVVPSRGTVVHSQYVKQKILRYDASLHVEMIPMGIMPPDLSQYDVNTLRKQYQIPHDRFVVGAYGYIQPGKRIPELLHSFAELVKETPEALCLLVGHLASPQEVSNFDIRKLIRDLGIEKHVLITGFTPYNQFLDYLALSDVCVNLRHPTVRATSANILKIMAFGKPAIISDLGENLDFPSTVCIKIPLNDTEEEKIFQALVALSRNPEQRQTMGAQARKFIIEQHSIQQAADKYLAFCKKILSR